MRACFAAAALAGAVALAAPMPALAANDPFAGMYGNTLIITQPDGTSSRLFLNADHTWEQHTQDGTVLRGTYAWDDATHVCFTLLDPKPGPGDNARECDVRTGTHKPGESWSETDTVGATMKYQIVTGRQ